MTRFSYGKSSFTVPLVLTFSFVFCISLMVQTHPAYSKDATLQEDLVDEARITLRSFLADEHMTWLRDHIKDARGVLVVPQMLKGAFFIGGSGGSGILVVRDEKTNEWSQPAFFTLGGASFGFQFGGQASEVVLLVMSQKGVDSLMSTTIKLGADASIAAGPIGAGVEGSTAPNLSADLLSFSRAKGLFAGVSLEGAAIAARDAWNTAYYGKETKTTDILIRRNVDNSHSSEFLKVVSEATQTE